MVKPCVQWSTCHFYGAQGDARYQGGLEWGKTRPLQLGAPLGPCLLVLGSLTASLCSIVNLLVAISLGSRQLRIAISDLRIIGRRYSAQLLLGIVSTRKRFYNIYDVIMPRFV